MRFFLLVISVLLFLSSCENDEEIITSIIKMQERARVQFENEIGYLRMRAQRNAEENPDKYEYVSEKLDQPVSDFMRALEDDKYCIENCAKLISDIKSDLEQGFHDLRLPDSLWTFSISDSPSKLELSSMKLALAACYQDYCLIHSFDSHGGAFKFYHLTPFEIAITSSECHFALVGPLLYGNKNELRSFQVDSIFKNGRPLHLQSKILPNSLATVSIMHEGKGEYEVFGHMDILEQRYNRSFDFSHSFTISE